ncbi:4Fe-4S dicluster domain-containing protein [Candidatus Bathyarchaeota archaeon]|nr:4Fe-4S dicluster domain-containing protein [Candidatus Bathyarchaeota archaeon]
MRKRWNTFPKVVVDHKKCSGEATCVNVCPVNVFEIQELPDFPNSPKAVPVRATDCIQCLACVASCPENAITVSD